MVPTYFLIVCTIALPTMFPTDSRTRSRPISTLCPRPISRALLDPFHDPCQPKNRGLPSRPVNQIVSRLPVPFPPRGKRTGTFSRVVAREDLKQMPPAGAKGLPSRTDRRLPYRAYPWYCCRTPKRLSLIPVQISPEPIQLQMSGNNDDDPPGRHRPAHRGNPTVLAYR